MALLLLLLLLLFLLMVTSFRTRHFVHIVLSLVFVTCRFNVLFEYWRETVNVIYLSDAHDLVLSGLSEMMTSQ
jgi:hypothetical protein